MALQINVLRTLFRHFAAACQQFEDTGYPSRTLCYFIRACLETRGRFYDNFVEIYSFRHLHFH